MSSHTTRRNVAAGILLMCLAAAVRLHRASVTMLGEEEFLVLNQPHDTGFIDYMVRMHSISPDHLPTYYLFTYYLRMLFNYHWLVPRGLSLVLGVAAIMLIWRIGCKWLGQRSAFLAALFLAVSPADVYYGATWRSYAMQIALAVLSFALIDHARRTGQRRYWLATVATNTLNVLIHPWGLLIVGAEGTWLLGERAIETWKTANRMALLGDLFVRGLYWSLGHLLALAAALGWWASGTSEGLKWYLSPRWDYFATDILGDGFLHGNLFTYDTIIARGYASYAEMAYRGPWDPALTRIADVTLAAAMLLGIACAGYMLRNEKDPIRSGRIRLLFLLAFFPALFLYFLAVVWFPVALPRYTAGSNTALYLLVATGLASLNRRIVGNAIAGILAVCLLFNSAMWERVIPDPDWPGASELVRKRPNPAAEVILLEFTPKQECDNMRRARSLLEYAYNAAGTQFRQAPTIAGAVDACAAQILATGRPACLLTRSVWNIEDDRKAVAGALRSAGLHFRDTVYKDFVVYTVTAPQPVRPWAMPPDGRRAEYLAALRPYLSTDLPESEVNAALRWAVEDADSMADLTGSPVASILMLEISPEMALAAGKLQASQDEEGAASALLLARRALGDATVDDSATENAARTLGPLVSRRLIKAIGNHDMDAARDVVASLKGDSGVLIPQAIMQLLHLEERLPYAVPIR